MCVSGGCVPLSVHPPLALDPRFPAHLHEAMHAVSHFISDLCKGKGCQVNSSAPHCLLSPRPGHSGAWHSSLQDLARQGVSGSPRGEGGGTAEAVQTPQVNSLGSLGVVSFDSPPPLPPLLTSLLPPSLLTPTPLSPFLDMLIMYHSIPRSTCG